MNRLALLLALMLAAPAQANDRADSEARLAALADQIIPALAAAMPAVEGMDCTAAAPDPSPTNRLLLPNWRAECRWMVAGEPRQSDVVLILSASAAEITRRGIAETAARIADGTALPGTQVFGTPEPKAELLPHRLRAAPGPRIAAQASVPRGGDEPLPPPGIEALAAALAAMDVTALESLPAVTQHATALADHRRLLEAQRETLRQVLGKATGTEAGPLLGPGMDYPDVLFFGAEPLVQADATEGGVAMTATLTTSSFALEAKQAEGSFAGRHKNGDKGRDGVFHDRGRVQVYLSENSLTALIDGRAMLMLYVPDDTPGTDPVAAMEAVLARIAATDFTAY
jgi:hypothetical protein